MNLTVGSYVFPHPRFEFKVPSEPRQNCEGYVTVGSWKIWVSRPPRDGEVLLLVKRSLSGRSYFAHWVGPEKARHQIVVDIRRYLTMYSLL